MHRFLANPKTIAAGGLGGAVRPPGDPRRCLGEGMGVKPLNNVFFSSVKWINLGQNLKNPKKILGQTLKSQVKKELPFPCIPIFKNL